MKNYFSIDIGGTFVKFALLTECGEVVESGKFETPENFESFLEQISKLVKNFEERFTIHGIAISSPGAVDPNSGIVHGASAIHYIHGFSLTDMLKERLGYEVSIENDANCAALAEGWIGSASDSNYYACIVIGTGIGGSIVHNGNILRGANRHGGEFGYMITDAQLVNPLERIWSLKGSTSALVRSVEQQKDYVIGTLNGEKVFSMIEENDPDAVTCYKAWIRNLAIGIYNIQYLIDPQKILIGGGVSKRSKIFTDLNEELTKLVDEISTLKITVEPCKLENDANLVGALFHFLKNNEEK